jgi:serine/threonine protein kinase
MFCSRCGSEVQEPTQFCPTCGLDLRGSASTQAAASGELSELDIIKQALGAEYEILDELGRGGMAIVYRAKDLQLEREVALKVLPFSLAFDQEFVERFQREARTAAQLEHPNIIPIYRVGKSGRVIFFVMKLLRGRSLSRLLGEKRRLPPSEIRRLLIEAGNALGYAAKHDIVHRDIKPDNIMFDDFGQCVVADFGIAKAASGQRLTGTGMSIGTPHYMSPEQARAQAIDGRSDIYSLGVVAYQCLVGEVPYDGEDSFAIGYKHIMDPIPTPTLATAEERRLYEIIRRMLAKDPKDRFQNADELIYALEGQGLSPGTAPSRASSSIRPNLTNAPTTPIPKLPTSAGVGASEGLDSARRPATSGRRAVAQPKESSRLWLWGLLLLAGAGGVGGYYKFLRHSGNQIAVAPADSGRSISADSVPSRAPLPVDTVRVVDTVRLPPSKESRKDSIPVAAPHRDSAAPPARVDSGSMRVVGLPRNSSVMVDQKPVVEALIRLPTGPHELAIIAPGHQFYVDTVTIQVGQVLEFTPELVPLGGVAPLNRRRMEQAGALSCDIPNEANRFGRSCYDQPPEPLGSIRAPVTPEVSASASPAVFLVLVSLQGQTTRVVPRGHSSDPAFQRIAEQFALRLQWRPASKAGTPLAGWTQIVIWPDR